MTNDFFNQKQSLATIIRISLSAFRKNLKYIALAGLFVILPLNLILLLIPMPSLLDVQNYLVSQTMNLNLTDSPEFKKLAVYMYTIFGIAIIFSPLSAGIAAYLAKTHVDSKESSFQGFLDSSIVKWGKHFSTSLLYNLVLGLLVAVSSLFLLSGIGAIVSLILIIPIVIYGIGYSFHSVIVATTNKWFLSALKESLRIIRPILMPALGFKIIVSVLSYIFTVAYSFVTELLLTLISTISPGTFYVFNFIFSVAGDTLRIFFLILSAVWFMNIQATANNGS